MGVELLVARKGIMVREGASAIGEGNRAETRVEKKKKRRDCH